MSRTFSSSNYRRLPCSKESIGPEEYIEVEQSANVEYKERWKSTYNYKDSEADNEDPITSLKEKSINIGSISIGALSEIYDTCCAFRISDDPDKKYYVIKTADRSKKLHRLYKEIIILCTIPPHKNILGRPSIVTADWIQQDYLSNITNSGTAVIGFMNEYVKSGTLEMNLKRATSLGKDIPGPTQVSWSLQLIDALIHLHRVAGIAHLALKLGNILVDTNPAHPEVGGRIILIDFEQSGASLGYQPYDVFVEKRGGATILKSNFETQEYDVHSLAIIIWMIFESCGSYTKMFLTRPEGDELSIHHHFTASMLHWFRKTPKCMRKILYECTKEYALSSDYPTSFETLRKVIGDTTRHPWSPSYKSFDTSLTKKLWKMEVDAGLAPTKLTDLYGRAPHTYNSFAYSAFSTHRKAEPLEMKSKEGDGMVLNVTLGENVEIGGVKDAKQGNSDEIAIGVKDAKQQIAELRAQIEGWHEYTDFCYCILPEEASCAASCFIDENADRRRRMHGLSSNYAASMRTVRIIRWSASRDH